MHRAAGRDFIAAGAAFLKGGEFFPRKRRFGREGARRWRAKREPRLSLRESVGGRGAPRGAVLRGAQNPVAGDAIAGEGEDETLAPAVAIEMFEDPAGAAVRGR